MNKIGNYKSWIKQEWIDYIINNDGEKHLKQDQLEYGVNNRIDKLLDSGWILNRTLWQSYEAKTLPFEVTMPFESQNKIDWWFVKLNCGDMIPWHQDHNHRDFEGLRSKRYWMPLQDYITGHVFINEKYMPTEYKAGDLFAYDTHAFHGAVNLNKDVPRITFNYVEYYV